MGQAEEPVQQGGAKGCCTNEKSSLGKFDYYKQKELQKGGYDAYGTWTLLWD